MDFYLLMALVAVFGFLIAYYTFRPKFKIAFCLGWTLVVLFSVIFIAVGPKTEIKPIAYGKGKFLKTLNEITVYLVVIEYFVLQLASFFIVKKKKAEDRETPLVAGIVIALALVGLGVGWALHVVKSIAG